MLIGIGYLWYVNSDGGIELKTTEEDVNMEQLHDCHDCGAKPGQQHMQGCDTERCSVCGNQRISCPCPDENQPEAAGHPVHDPAFARWTGLWPGFAEMTVLGLTLNDMAGEHLRAFFIKPTTGRA